MRISSKAPRSTCRSRPYAEILRQDEMHVGRVDLGEVGLLDELAHLRHQPLLHGGALLGAECARVQEVAVGVERLIALLELEQLHGVGMPAPVVEIAHEAAHPAAIVAPPKPGVRQPIEQRVARDGQELLAAKLGGLLRVRVHAGKVRRATVAARPTPGRRFAAKRHGSAPFCGPFSDFLLLEGCRPTRRRGPSTGPFSRWFLRLSRHACRGRRCNSPAAGVGLATP